MRRILKIIQKEFLQISRDVRTLVIVVLSPVLQLLLLGYAANMDVKDAPLLVCDMDRSAESRRLIESMVNARYFKLVGVVPSKKEIDGAIENQTASLALVIPARFSDDLGAGRNTQVFIAADGSDSNSATICLSYATMILTSYSRNIMVQRLTRSGGAPPPVLNPEIRVFYNPNMESRNFMVPGILAMILMMITMILTSMAIVREREIGTMEQLNVTPIRPVELIIGKLAPFTIIAFIDVFLVLLVNVFVFQIPIKGNVFLLFGLTGIFLLSTLGIGLFISTISRTQQQAMFSSMFFVMMPMIILSGFIFPIENMPQVIQYFTYLMPLRYYFVIVRGLFLKGADITHLWDEALILLVLGIGILAISALRIKKRLK
jgi:ABC-2 type transport system permease protein